jgi:hypothetical protein
LQIELWTAVAASMKMSKQALSIVEADVHVAAPPQKRKDWRRFVWDSFDKSPEERHFIFKLDLALLTFGCLGSYFQISPLPCHSGTLFDVANYRHRILHQVS